MPNTIGSPLFELALVLVRLDHVARFIVSADHRILLPKSGWLERLDDM
jgi:hypothetical protein